MIMIKLVLSLKIVLDLKKLFNQFNLKFYIYRYRCRLLWISVSMSLDYIKK